jgi:hypothetical protein
MRKILSVALVSVFFASGVEATAKGYSPRVATAQRKPLLVAQGPSFAPLRLCASNLFQETFTRAIEVFQVLELPLNVHEASLVKSEKGYSLQLSLANSSDSKMLGLRYSLIRIDSRNQARPIANRTEGISMPAYTTKTLSFRAPQKFKVRDGERLVLMLEQTISRESIWEVVKAKEALDSYARGDFSVMPVVLRVANHVDVPIGQKPYIKR